MEYPAFLKSFERGLLQASLGKANLKLHPPTPFSPLLIPWAKDLYL